MRILIVHNYYQDPGGEDAVFEQETNLLAKSVTVNTINFKNHRGFKGLLQFAAYPWNIVASRKLLQAVKKFQPDIVHIHNLHYALGPLVIRILHKRNIPIVMTLHNYRLLCPSATLYDDGKVYTKSLNQIFPWDAVKLGLYSHSRLKTFWLALTYYIHKQLNTWKKIDQYLVLSDFAKKLFISSTMELSAEKFTVKPNFVADQLINESTKIPKPAREPHFLFVGRLTEEKGIDLLLEVFAQATYKLKIAGDGPLREKVIQATKTRSTIEYLGVLDHSAITCEMQKCSALLFPSLWYEGMPMTLIEAFSTGTPVIASRLGAMESMITHGENGLLFPPGDIDVLQQQINYWMELEGSIRDTFNEKSRKTYDMHYTPERNLKLLLSVYKNLLSK